MEILDVKLPNSEENDEEKSLCVLTEKHANLGRFFNSVNTSQKDWKIRQNVRTMRC
jgi:hypothetical protein